jgi:hypothetical protein
LIDAASPDRAVVGRLMDQAGSYTWVAATIGSMCASGYQLATRNPVLPIGGFNGSDPWPPEAEFQRLAVSGKIHYFIVDTTNADPAEAGLNLNNSGLIQQWVEQLRRHPDGRCDAVRPDAVKEMFAALSSSPRTLMPTARHYAAEWP